MIDSLAKKKMMLQEQWYQRSKQEDQKLNRFGETYHKKKTHNSDQANQVYPSQYTIYIWSNILYKRTMIKIDKTYVSITLSHIQSIYICWGRENIRHKMLDNTEYNKKSIDNY